jgi:hypothetical protein
MNCSIDGGLEKSSAPNPEPCLRGELAETRKLPVCRRLGIGIDNRRRFFAYPLGLIYSSFGHVCQMGVEFRQSCREFEKEAAAIDEWMVDTIVSVNIYCARDFRQ